MRRKMWAILSVLLFVVLLSPVKVHATEPSYLYPLGIVIEVNACDERSVDYDQFIIDIVVKREDFSGELLEEPRLYTFAPSALFLSEYANPENEWISVALLERDYVWNNENCKALFYEHAYDEDDFPFTEYKVVIYERGKDPVVSKTYFTSNSATWTEPEGHKVMYNPDDQTFFLAGYEAEMVGGYNPGFFNSLGFLIAAFATVIVLVFGLMESFIYLVARQGKKAVLIPLGFNLLALGYVVSQFVEVFRLSEELYAIFGILLIPNLFIGKVLLLNKYAAMVYKVSILFSTIFYSIYFFFFIQAMW